MSQTIKVDKFEVHYHNKEEILEIKKEVFAQHVYYFETENPRPVIIDAGAHIGLATLYFKKQYPEAQVIAIEPNTINFKLLEENIWENQLDDVTTINAALTPGGDTVTLNADTKQTWLSTASVHEGAWNGDQTTQPTVVPAIQLSSLLTDAVDFLKLDIEGTELAVLREAQDLLYRVKKIVLEFHPHPSQTLEELDELLTTRGFTVKLSKNGGRITIYQAKGLILVEAERTPLPLSTRTAP